MRVQITQNPADEDHWTSQLSEEPHEYLTLQNPITGEYITIYKDTFWIPKGENKHLSPLTRAAQMAAFKDDPAKWQRYVEGETATIQLGKKVTPGYHPAIHFSKNVLPVYKSGMLQFWDGWQHPSCIIAQYNAFGQLVIHDVLVGEEIGTKELIEEQIDPLLNTPKYKDQITSWRIIGDPTMRTPDQSSIRSTTAKIVEKRFEASFEPGPSHWHVIKEPLNRCFKRFLNEGRPAVILSRSAVKLHRALKGGWHYKTDNNGVVVGDKPIKNIHSHPGDAFSYGIAILTGRSAQKKIKKQSIQQRQKRALSYRGGNYSRASENVNVMHGG